MCISDDFIGNVVRRKVALWCFNPSFAFRSLMQEHPRSVIFTSGTLAPLNTFQSELDTPFPVTLETDHVSEKGQVLVAALTCDHESKPVRFGYQSGEEVCTSLARTLTRLVAKVPQGGVLVFLPSYSMLKRVQKVWRAQQLFKELAREGGQIFIEHQD